MTKPGLNFKDAIVVALNKVHDDYHARIAAGQHRTAQTILEAELRGILRVLNRSELRGNLVSIVNTLGMVKSVFKGKRIDGELGELLALTKQHISDEQERHWPEYAAILQGTASQERDLEPVEPDSGF